MSHKDNNKDEAEPEEPEEEVDTEEVDNIISRLQEASVDDLATELFNRSNFGCIVIQMSAKDQPFFALSASKFSMNDMLTMMARLEIASDFFKAQILEDMDIDEVTDEDEEDGDIDASF